MKLSHTFVATLPRDLRELTDDQDLAIVAFYCSLKLSDLRQRQSINAEQRGEAWKRGLYGTIERLDVTHDQLARAVSESALGEKLPRGFFR